MPPTVVLVTGVSRWLGGALAAELARDPAIERVVGRTDRFTEVEKIGEGSDVAEALDPRR